MTVLDVIHEVQAEAEVAHDFIERLWAWLDDDEAPGPQTVECGICGAPVPESWITEDEFCRVCAAQ